MSLISGKEALIALANGEEVQVKLRTIGKWVSIIELEEYKVKDMLLNTHGDKFRLKPRTITLNGIEVPAPFEPKDGDTVFVLANFLQQGYLECKYPTFEVHVFQFGAWRTEDEIKQVVTALRIEEIRKGAPSGASHYDGEEYWQYHNDKWWVYSHYYKLWEESKPTINDLVSIV